MKKQSFFNGAMILLIGTALTKLLGAIFTIPLANIIGSEGMGYFYTAYDLYSRLVVLCVAGIPVAISRMISQISKDESGLYRRSVLKVALITFSIVGLAALLFLFFGADWIASIQGNPNAAVCIRVLAPATFFISFSAVCRGYFQGQKNMTPTAVSQTLEALGQVLFGIVLAYELIKIGTAADGAAGAIVGVSAGTLISAVYLLIYFLKNSGKKAVLAVGSVPSAGHILAQLVKTVIPITIGISTINLLNMADSLTVMNLLQSKAGLPYDAANVLYGVYGNSRKLYNLPISFIVPLAASIIPYMTSTYAEGDHEHYGKMFQSILKITNLLAMPSGIGLIALSQQLYDLLYFTEDSVSTTGGTLLAILGIGVIFGSLTLITCSILQTKGKEILPVFSLLTALIIKVGLNLLLINSELSIFAAAISTSAALFAMATINLIMAYHKMPKMSGMVKTYLGPLVCSLVMGAVCYGGYLAFYRLVSSRLAVLPAILVGVVVYAWLIIRFQIISAEEMEHLPKGQKIASMLHIK